jgi:hypothetical protein
MKTAQITVLVAMVLFSPKIALAQDKTLPPNNIVCDDFKQIGPNEWTNVRPVNIVVGTSTFGLHVAGAKIIPHLAKLDGNDLEEMVGRKCGHN